MNCDGKETRRQSNKSKEEAKRRGKKKPSEENQTPHALTRRIVLPRGKSGGPQIAKAASRKLEAAPLHGKCLVGTDRCRGVSAH